MNDIEPLLGRIPLFSSLLPDALHTLAGRMRRRRLPAGAVVVYRGDPAGALYVILSGQVKVHTATAGGDEVILDVQGPGAFFGEMSLLDGRPRSADVTTLEATELALLDGDALRETVEQQPSVAWALLRFLSVRLREQNDQMEMLMTRDVAGRVAGLLLNLADSQGRLLADGRQVRIEVTLTQSDIAAFVGATRERVSRALGAFRTQGAISWDKGAGRWIVCDRTILAKRAEM
jgi:CRP/FNR family cyclic AMP-dependent transcriptional regulator